MKHLQVFTEWQQKQKCGLASLKQFNFFQYKLNQAVKVHSLKVEKLWNNCYSFDLGNGKTLNIELKQIGQGQLYVNTYDFSL